VNQRPYKSYGIAAADVAWEITGIFLNEYFLHSFASPHMIHVLCFGVLLVNGGQIEKRERHNASA
jgi:hypothetical protein